MDCALSNSLSGRPHGHAIAPSGEHGIALSEFNSTMWVDLNHKLKINLLLEYFCNSEKRVSPNPEHTMCVSPA